MLFSSRLRPLRVGHASTLLSFYPSQLTTAEIVQVILAFLFRTILSFLHLAPIFEIRDVDTDAETYMLPDLRLSMPFRIADEDLLTYAKAIDSPTGVEGFNQLFEDPAQICLMLSAFSEPAFLLLLAHSQCPIQPLGAVNVRNRFELLRQDLCTRKLLAESSWEVRASFFKDTRKVRHGLEIDVVVEMIQVGSGVVVFRQIFTMLQFMKFRKVPVAVDKREITGAENESSAVVSEITYKTSASRTMLWAKACKDYNPLHTSKLAAKLFGFKGKIAHGNHAVASGLHNLRIKTPSPSLNYADKMWTIEVQFRRPIVLPARLEIKMESEGEHMCHFRVRSVSNQKVLVAGIISEGLQAGK